MRLPSTKWRIVIGLLALVFIAGWSGVLLLSSDWLRDRIRTTIVESASKAAGGRVELDGFRYDWRRLTVDLSRIAIHGSEPAGQPPLLETGPVHLQLEIISLMAMQVRPAVVEVTQPRAHLIVQPDGSTNLPRPRTGGKKTVPETIVDLKIGRFVVRDGLFVVETPERPRQALPFAMRGEGLRALFTFEELRARYAGELALGKLLWNGMTFELSTQALMERNRVVLQNASVNTGETRVRFAQIALEDLAKPVVTANWEAQVAVGEWASKIKGLPKVQGSLRGSGTAEYRSTTDYTIGGTIQATGVSLDRFRNIRADATLAIKPNLIQLTDVRAGVLGGSFAGSVEVRDLATVAVKGRASQFRLAQLASTFGVAPLPYDAMISGPVEASGPFARLKASANLKLAPAPNTAPVNGLIAASYDQGTQKVDLGMSWVELPHSRVDVSGVLGAQLDVKATSTNIADLQPLLPPDAPKFEFATAAFSGTVTGPLQSPRIQGMVRGTNIVANGVTLESVSGDVTAVENQVQAKNVRVAYSGARVRLDGSISLAAWRVSKESSVAGTLTADDLDLGRILALAGYKDFPATGRLNGTGQVVGTLADPHVNGDVTISKGTIYDQPFDSLTARVQAISSGEQTMTGLFVSGPKRVNLSGRYEHAGRALPEGQLEFSATSNTMPLNQIELIRKRQPNILGFGKFHADGSLKITRDAKKELQIDVVTVNGDASANGVEIEGRSLGDTRLTAVTRGDTVTAHFESSAPNVTARADATMQITGDYPVKADIKFSDTTVGALAALLLKPEDARKLSVDGSAEAEVRVTGPARRPAEIRAEVNVGKLDFRPAAGSSAARLAPSYALVNDGPIRVTITKAGIRVDSAKFKGPQTDLSVTGAASFEGDSPLDGDVKGQINLALLEMFDRDLSSSGMLILDAAIKGTAATPAVNGRATLKNGEAHYTGFSNGLSNANGEIVFNGSRATIQSLSADTGGGRVDLSGFAALSNGVIAFRVDAKAREVRVRLQEGLSSVSHADVTLAGTSQRSLISGEISVQRITVNPQSDAASLLALSSQPLQTASAQTGLLANMNLDIKISTAPDVVVQTNLTQSLQADANLRLRGTATNPAILGRVNVTNGELIFFGNKYTISQGAISFYNPTKIEPIVNFDLQTRARGVDVILTVSGQLTKLNLSYRSDPPLQFSEIVALLATGRAPTDATLAARDTGASQSLQDLGASALVGQAIANPVAGRLQRFFGVSRLKIDPRLTGITGSPQARLTIEQQITPDVLFTYVTDVSNTSTQLVRVEWAMNRNWSALLTREENGKVGLDFSFKKRFK